MRLSPLLIAAVLASFALCGACSLDFTKKEVSEAGISGDNRGSNESEGGQVRDDAGRETTSDPDSGPVSTECFEAADCGDPEKFDCAENSCIEHECHQERPCAGLSMCEAFRCVPFVPPERFPTGYSQTSGGGEASSSKYRVRVSAGTPQPYGSASSSKFRVTLGPGAGRK